MTGTKWVETGWDMYKKDVLSDREFTAEELRTLQGAYYCGAFAVTELIRRASNSNVGTRETRRGKLENLFREKDSFVIAMQIGANRGKVQ